MISHQTAVKLLLFAAVFCLYFTSTGVSAVRVRVRYSSYSYTRYSYYSYYSYYYSYARYYRPYYYGYYYYYYYFYYYYSPGYYLSSPDQVPGYTVCQNYVANANGSYLGYFVCPMDFEPDDFTSCCGDSDAQYCCRATTSSNVGGIIAGVIIAVFLLIIIPLVIWRCIVVSNGGFRSSRTIHVERHETVITTSSSRPHPVPPPPSLGYGGTYPQPAAYPSIPMQPVQPVQPPPYQAQPYGAAPSYGPAPGQPMAGYSQPGAGTLSPPPTYTDLYGTQKPV